MESIWCRTFSHPFMFMVVMNVRTAMISEATLSFMGIGLPIEVITWGSMLSLSDKALMTGSWWIILIPGLFLITTVLCLTNIGNACREQTNRKESTFLKFVEIIAVLLLICLIYDIMKIS